jgi:plasmid stabilization system protein ParE
MSRILWTPIAENDLEEILLYIAVEGARPETARRVGEEIREAIDCHFSNSLPGQRHAAMPESWRYLKHKRWLVAYEPASDDAIIHRVVDAVRDLLKQFGQER